VVEIQVNGNEPVILKDGLGYKKDADLEAIKKQLEANAKKDLDVSQKAEITVNLPHTKRKPLKLTVQGTQPLEPKIIYHPGWPPPEPVKEDIKKEWKQNPNRKTASDLEAMAYLSTASLAAPLSEQWTRIYMHVARKYFASKGHKITKGSALGFLKEYTLRPEDERELIHLKGWIFKQQQTELAQRRKLAKSG